MNQSKPDIYKIRYGMVGVMSGLARGCNQLSNVTRFNSIKFTAADLVREAFKKFFL